MFVSGPHVGVRSDIRIWREFGPAMVAGESSLGDKAYVANDVLDVIAPYKKEKGSKLTLSQRDFNRIHRSVCYLCSSDSTGCSWFRATIEHMFAQFKKFQILGQPLSECSDLWFSGRC